MNCCFFVCQKKELFICFEMVCEGSNWSHIEKLSHRNISRSLDVFCCMCEIVCNFAVSGCVFMWIGFHFNFILCSMYVIVCDSSRFQPLTSRSRAMSIYRYRFHLLLKHIHTRDDNNCVDQLTLTWLIVCFVMGARAKANCHYIVKYISIDNSWKQLLWDISKTKKNEEKQEKKTLKLISFWFAWNEREKQPQTHTHIRTHVNFTIVLMR